MLEKKKNSRSRIKNRKHKNKKKLTLKINQKGGWEKNNIEATIVAEGPITKGDINTLSITGGTGIFKRTVGTVVLETGNLRNGSPPIFIPSNRLDLPSSYLVKMFVFMDSVDLELM